MQHSLWQPLHFGTRFHCQYDQKTIYVVLKNIRKLFFLPDTTHRNEKIGAISAELLLMVSDLGIVFVLNTVQHQELFKNGTL